MMSSTDFLFFKSPDVEKNFLLRLKEKFCKQSSPLEPLQRKGDKSVHLSTLSSTQQTTRCPENEARLVPEQMQGTDDPSASKEVWMSVSGSHLERKLWLFQ